MRQTLDVWTFQRLDISTFGPLDCSTPNSHYDAHLQSQSFEPQMHHLCQRHCLGTHGGCLRSNSRSESENSALSFDRAQQSIEAHETRRLLKMGTEAKHSVSQSQLEDCVAAQDLSTTVVQHGRNDMFSEFPWVPVLAASSLPSYFSLFPFSPPRARPTHHHQKTPRRR